MLRITFTPPGGAPRLFELAGVDSDLSALEAELIEESGGRQWATLLDWAGLMSQGSFRAVRVLLWVLLRRENPSLDLAEFDFPVSAVNFEEVDDEPSSEPGKDVPADSATSGT